HGPAGDEDGVRARCEPSLLEAAVGRRERRGDRDHEARGAGRTTHPVQEAAADTRASASPARADGALERRPAFRGAPLYPRRAAREVRATFDTNVLVYASDRAAGPRQLAAADLIERG